MSYNTRDKFSYRDKSSKKPILKILKPIIPHTYPDLRRYRVTVMGLGLHGGGLVSSLFFLSCGAEVIITDLKKREELNETIVRLENEKPPNSTYKLILGEHRDIDFRNTDLVIKNPGVPWTSRYLKIAMDLNIPIETDISIFLRLKNNSIIAVTGSKGKSTTATAIHYLLKGTFPNVKLGGNITVSPLSFIHQLKPGDPIVLELSSWQLADLRGKEVLKPKISLITNILHDHQDKYKSMGSYIDDKKVILENQDRNDFTLLNLDDTYWIHFADSTRAKILFGAAKPFPEYGINLKTREKIPVIEGAYLEKQVAYLLLTSTSPMLKRKAKETFPIKIFDSIRLRGNHNRKNMLMASLAAYLFGVEIGEIRNRIPTFGGLEHRMELFLELPFGKEAKLLFYNDSAATIPDATANAILSIENPLILITGGTDKNLDFSVLNRIILKPEEIFLLKGSATDKIIYLLTLNKKNFKGPYENLENLLYDLKSFLDTAYSGTSLNISVVFSPGCASFELFKNEFHRGRIFKQLVDEIFNQDAS